MFCSISEQSQYFESALENEKKAYLFSSFRNDLNNLISYIECQLLDVSLDGTCFELVDHAMRGR